MVKFTSFHKVLGVMKCAQANKVDTNLFNQILLILDHLGVEDSLFLNLQQRACAECFLKYDNSSQNCFT